MKAAFVFQPHYFSCAIPDKIDGWDIIKKEIDWKNFEPLRGLTADVIFILRADMLPVEIIRSMKGKLVWLATEPLQRKAIIHHYSKLIAQKIDWALCTHNNKNELHDLEVIGFHGVEFQLPVNLDRCKSFSSLKDIDLFFSGKSTESREYFMEGLKHRYDLVHIAHGLSDPELSGYIARSKICLNLLAGEYPQMQNRLQNYLAAGAFVLSQKQAHEDDLQSGVHYVMFTDKKDLEEKITCYLGHKEERNIIALAGMKAVWERFDANKCWAELLQKVN